MSNEISTQVVVIGAGPGGYSAAFRAADLGKSVVLVEKHSTLGGVCLNVGCIPSKALLHVSKVINEAKHLATHGVSFGEPNIDINGIRDYKNGVISKLTTGLAGMAKARKVTVVNGWAQFKDKNSLTVALADGTETVVKFENAIIACGSTPVTLPFIPHEDPRVWDSTDALKMEKVPARLAVVGGGVIGMEMATVYSTLGSKVTVIEPANHIIPPADADLVKVLTNALKDKITFHTDTGVKAVEAKEDAVYVTTTGAHEATEPYDAILVSVGRRPNGKALNAEAAGVKVTDRGFIEVDKQMRTNVENIFAIGDVVGQPMLAHKAVHEGHVAAEVIAGSKHYFDPRVIPSIAYTEPELAWVGKTEQELKAEGVEYEAAVFPWAASGRALASDAANGMTKLIFDKATNTVLGAGIVGTNAGELLGEVCLAIEMGADAEDIALTIHAHPTLHESVGLAAEIYTGTVTDLPNKKAVKK
ncbi:dihydrolipoyl dehydrogenase [Psittacicella hinzii]|uniref:Dihydrolipoyl dehydrogenase n=1 Tax=Psittacicella hinzii TaxID=2028575 RepID=A0A3A1YC02_9GAMM|nr:dihydrolipoyl dehydrogenase [Psittacicella hinzii]RIY34700.1 dihydrolipoyl dehydrogenase [Psittacicella hinzii]